jgi:uracil-DNA glycosylase
LSAGALGRWEPYLRGETQKPYFEKLLRQVREAREKGPVYPPEQELFAAFRLTPPERVRAVILGQDPYHEPGQAHGLAFSVLPGTPLPPSLRNIFTELQSDLQLPAPQSGCLCAWAEQGVFLLNTVLSVADGQANSHKDFGWQRFTDAAVAAVGAFPQPVAFVLWGAQAQKKAACAAASPYPRLIVQSPHPSPLSAYRGFFGSRPFSRINEFLAQNGERPIDWAL